MIRGRSRTSSESVISSYRRYLTHISAHVENGLGPIRRKWVNNMRPRDDCCFTSLCMMVTFFASSRVTPCGCFDPFVFDSNGHKRRRLTLLCDRFLSAIQILHLSEPVSLVSICRRSPRWIVLAWIHDLFFNMTAVISSFTFSNPTTSLLVCTFT